MIPVLSVAQTRTIDEQAINGSVEAGYSYMLRAGSRLFCAAKAMVHARRGEIAVICGKGNNGGDGFVAARLLLEAGFRVMCFGLAHPRDLSGEARLAGDQYLASNGNFMLLDDVEDLAGLPDYGLIIDALLGTGAKGPPRRLAAEIIDVINKSGVPVLAVDTPSGLNNDTGIPESPCVNASVTVTMGFPKTGAYFYPGRSCVGNYIIADLGYPQEIVDKNLSGLFLPACEDMEKLLPARKPAGSKFDHGVVCMLCGSAGMTGSATLASKSAMRTGCGMVHLFAPKSAIPVLSVNCIEVVMHGIAETKAGTPAYMARNSLRDFAEKSQAFCIGPGISHSNETGRLVREAVAEAICPVILDADGINAFRGRAKDLKKHSSKLCITPHGGEWSRLFGDLPAVPLEAIRALMKKAEEFSMTILYKGNPTIIADPSGCAWLLPFGNSGMATAGCGDVLSGIIASLAAQGLDITYAAILGAYIHQMAGVAASSEFGEHGMMAGDLLQKIPQVIKSLAVPAISAESNV
jgi:ADP-dependent NAD(P)H-hydrate dehydratase / NAD(P)H-hydrate epimerase